MKTAILSKAGGRKHNEDYCSYLEKSGYGCYILADGLGGHRGGAYASRIIVESVLEAFSANPGFTRELLKNYLENARNSFLDAQNQDGSLKNMKATVVIVLSDFQKGYWAHIGDSRLYFFREGKLQAQTSDHSVPGHMFKIGDISYEQIRFHEDRNRLTRAFDGGEISRFEFATKAASLNGGDAILLCTDGFWEYVLEKEMQSDLVRANNPETWLIMMEKRLLSRAEKGHDNYSAVAIYC